MLICPECTLSGVSERPQSVIEFQKLQPILGSRPSFSTPKFIIDLHSYRSYFFCPQPTSPSRGACWSARRQQLYDRYRLSDMPQLNALKVISIEPTIDEYKACDSFLNEYPAACCGVRRRNLTVESRNYFAYHLSLDA